MKNKTEKLLDALVDLIEDGAEFEKVQEALKKRGIQSLLKAELSGHLGYVEGDQPIGTNKRNGYSAKTLKNHDGEMRIKVPRDREGSFEPVIVPKHKSISQKLTDCIMLLYAKGMSNADIIDFMDHSYGVKYSKYSTSQVSIITNSLLEDIKSWQQRPLEDQYAVIWIDAIHVEAFNDIGRVD